MRLLAARCRISVIPLAWGGVVDVFVGERALSHCGRADHSDRMVVLRTETPLPVLADGWPLALQAGLVLALFAVPNSQGVLAGVTSAVDGLADAADRGAQFVFGYLSGGDQPYGAVAENAPFIFGFRVLPLILVISALSALLWHWGHIALADVGVRFRF